MTSMIDEFSRDGFVVVREAFSPDIARACLAAIHDELRARSVDPQDPSTWTNPVVRFSCPHGPSFEVAATSPALSEMYDALLGAGRWVPRRDVGGSVPVRFPSEEDPGDAGWHIDGSYDVDGQWWVNVHSRGRALLALFLFSDIGDRDAPTEILVGSHLDVPRILAPYGERGVSFGKVADQLTPSTFDRERAQATGRAGDVYLCHPFLIHRATWPHRGVGPRVLAQPGVQHSAPFALRDEPGISVVERTIIEALAAA